ncbi:hypothetical protein J2S40_000747 [Nocardioides luteus]|uniref:Squalene cyclase C-terminal domain-containing protein n=1 Tax=Nocardioides luteus TaxID=1844 RepID=A0ABQ5STD9_9ACTN|nr:prenyltransferase/squalene oxidase repeat-containing protein [Nocardioides luteus]MDR7309689.1 hypothetical protein [Nocardioides luteus]GGR61977.1 hypothetical protein GCM10010197_31650 [Nocardioides luteus]GLJ67402.1 hypothetical protein GCM10017579_14380 [Nocardioides luteus]
MKKTVLGGIAAALALTSLAGCGDEAVEEGEKSTYDANVSTSVGDWLVDQAPKGVVHNAQYGTDDFGLSAEIGIALAEIGGYDEEIATIAEAVMKHKKEYTSPGFGTITSAGATAKALVLQQNVDASDPGLLKQLEDTVAENGRIADVLDPENKKAADYSNTIGQSYAVWALTNAESEEAAAATEFLAGQQCEEGWFRVTFTPDAAAADQTCDADPKAAPDADATAYALIALSAVGTPETKKAVDAGIEWLKESQAKDGSLKSATGNVPNSNTTGLAGWAFGRAGETEAAEKAASWVAEHVVACGDDAGAVAYDDAALTEAEDKGLTKETEGMYRLAAAQALPSLVYLPKDATEKSSC